MILPIDSSEAPVASMSPNVTDSGDGTGLYFRVRGGEHDGRLVRLAQRKCTIGASPSCTLRLVSPACQPVHCVIVRGRRGTAVRRWSHDTRLNGHEFTDSWLQPGDCLQVGDVTLEMVADRLQPQELRDSIRQDLVRTVARSQLDESRVARQLGHLRLKRLIKLHRRATHQLGKLHVELETERLRIQDLNDAARHLQSQLGEATERALRGAEDAERNQQLAEQLRTDLTTLQQQFDEQRHESGRQQEAWLRHCRQIMQMLQLTQEELGGNGEAGDFEPLAGELANRWVNSQQEMTRHVAEAEAELASRRERLDAQFQQLLENQQHLLRREEELELLRQDLETQLHAAATKAANAEPSPEAVTWEERRRRDEVELAEQRTRLQREWDRLAEERATYANAAADAESQWQTRVELLQEQLQHSKSECSQAHTQLQILEGERLDLLRDVESLTLRLSDVPAVESLPQPDTLALEQQIADLTERCQSLTEELSRSRQDSARSVQDLAELQANLKEQSRQRDELVAQTEQLQRELQASQTQESPVGDVYEIIQERDALLERLSDHERQLLAARAELDFERAKASMTTHDVPDAPASRDAVDANVMDGPPADSLVTLQITPDALPGPTDVAVDAQMTVVTPPAEAISEETNEPEATGDEGVDTRTIALAELRDNWTQPTPRKNLYEDSRDEQVPSISDTMTLESFAANVADDSVGADYDTPETPDFSHGLYEHEYDEDEQASSAPDATQDDGPSRFTGTDTASILAKFGATFNFAEDGEEEHSDEEERSELPHASHAPGHLGGLHAHGGEDEESSIQQYMAELMRRNGAKAGGSGMSVSPPMPLPTSPSNVPTGRSLPSVRPAAPPREPIASEARDVDDTPVARKPRNAPAINLSAMRDVANSTARVDISRHNSRKEMEDAYFRWTVAAISSVIGFFLGMYANSPRSVAFWASAGCFCGSVYWAYSGMMTWKQVRAQRGGQDAPIDPRAHRNVAKHPPTTHDDVEVDEEQA